MLPFFFLASIPPRTSTQPKSSSRYISRSAATVSTFEGEIETNPVGEYLFKVINKDTRTTSTGAFKVALLSTLNKYMSQGKVVKQF